MREAYSSEKLIKVLFVTSLLDKPGGAEKNLCDIVLGLDRKKFSPHVLVFQGGELSNDLAKKGIPVQVNSLTKILSLDAARKGWETARYLRRERFDVVVTYHHDADIWGAVVSKLAGVPVVISSRRDMGYLLEPKHVFFYKHCHGLFSAFVTVSEAVKREVERREGIPGEKIVVIRNGIDLTSYVGENSMQKTGIIREELGINNGKVVIGIVASFRPIKAQILMADTVRNLQALGKDVQVVFVGETETDYCRLVKERIAEFGLSSKFLFAGVRGDVPRLLPAFDIFALTSESEGFSNAILEAMAAGLPIVAPNCGGNPEAVENGVTGFLYPPGDAKALAGCLAILSDDHALRKKMGRSGRLKTEKCFKYDGMIQANEGLYITTLREKGRLA